MKRALVTGITGQDGSYLAELLLQKGYEVHGLIRGSSKTANIAGIQSRLSLHEGSLGDHRSLEKMVQVARPDEFYHFAGSSFHKYSFFEESAVLNNNFGATHCLLGAIKEHAPRCRFYYAGSAEMFGAVTESPQTELTRFNPHSVYSVSKLASHHLVRFYRENHGIFGCTGILFNHESPRRGFEFVTRKITSTVAKIKLGKEKKLVLGNLDTVRDWGYAPDFVEAAWLMLQQERADDFVIAAGTGHTVREFADCAFRCVGLDYRDYVAFDEMYYRATESTPRIGDSSKARKHLKWAPKMAFESLVSEMVAADLKSS